MKIKTRFAPSPTGYLHVGGARTALYSWLFARNHGGEFVLRIEDTDLERSTPEAIEAIMDGMNWLSLEWDEGPYYQTKRFDRYNAVIDQMLEEGTAYKCYCSKERSEALREEQMAKGEKPRYDGRCRHSHEHHADDEPCVVRFANPQEGSVVFDDQIRGPIEFSNQNWTILLSAVPMVPQPITSVWLSMTGIWKSPTLSVAKTISTTRHARSTFLRP